MKSLLHSLLLLTTAITAAAQTPAPLTLDQMESIYQRELSARHIPLISKYLIELQRNTASSSSPSAWQSEIVRVQQLLKSGGVIDLATARAALDNTAEPMPMPSPLPRAVAQAVISLSPALAMVPPASNVVAAPVGELEWRVEFMAAGSYDIHIQYACPALAEEMTLRVDFNDQTIESTLDSSRITKDEKTLRIIRLGKITLPADVRAKTLRFVAGDKTTTALLLKQLFITPSTPPPPAP